MRFSFDPAKCTRNISKHGVDLAAIEEFDWVHALVRADVRFDYPEPRLSALIFDRGSPLLRSIHD
jgi:uncharacterized DUF497 family protein